MAAKVDEAQDKRGELELGALGGMFGYLLGRAFRNATRVFDAYYLELDLSARQFAIISLIGTNPGCSPGDLVKPIGITQNNLVTLIGDLVARQLVTKTTSPRDRRARMLRLTESGSALLRKAYIVHQKYDADFRGRIGGAELDELTRLLHSFDAI